MINIPNNKISFTTSNGNNIRKTKLSERKNGKKEKRSEKKEKKIKRSKRQSRPKNMILRSNHATSLLNTAIDSDLLSKNKRKKKKNLF